MDIASIREEIDITDRKIAELISHRYELTDAIGELKKHQSRVVKDPNRELLVIENAKNAADAGYSDEIEQIFRLIINLSCNRQENNI